MHVEEVSPFQSIHLESSRQLQLLGLGQTVGDPALCLCCVSSCLCPRWAFTHVLADYLGWVSFPPSSSARPPLSRALTCEGKVHFCNASSRWNDPALLWATWRAASDGKLLSTVRNSLPNELFKLTASSQNLHYNFTPPSQEIFTQCSPVMCIARYWAISDR